jgi:cobalamin biosynthesis protein CbiG
MTASISGNAALYVLGLGCERGTDAAEVLALARQALELAGIGPADVSTVASIDSRAEEPAILAVAQAFGVPSSFFPAIRLEEETPRIRNPSAIVFARVGCHGVAESAALAAAGPVSELVVPKIKSAHATAAVARILLQKE